MTHQHTIILNANGEVIESNNSMVIPEVHIVSAPLLLSNDSENSAESTLVEHHGYALNVDNSCENLNLKRRLDEILAAPPYGSGKKRLKLDHLTSDEKLIRRKVKNREAAQIARDRRRQYIDELEERLERLEADSAALKHKNSKLNERVKQLENENSRMRVQLNTDSAYHKKSWTHEIVPTAIVEPSQRSAAPDAPQQWDVRTITPSTFFRLVTTFLSVVVTAALGQYAQQVKRRRQVNRPDANAFNLAKTRMLFKLAQAKPPLSEKTKLKVQSLLQSPSNRRIFLQRIKRLHSSQKMRVLILIFSFLIQRRNSTLSRLKLKV